MPLPSVQDAKRYLRIEHTAEDTLLADLILEATGTVQRYVRRPLIAVERSYDGLFPLGGNWRHPSILQVPIWPIMPDVEVVDADGEEVEPEDMQVHTALGQITALRTFGYGPYTVTVTGGLSLMPDYETEVEPILRRAILDLVADAHQRRDPAVSSVSDGGGTSKTWHADGIPQRVKMMLDTFKPKGLR